MIKTKREVKIFLIGQLIGGLWVRLFVWLFLGC